MINSYDGQQIVCFASQAIVICQEEGKGRRRQVIKPRNYLLIVLVLPVSGMKSLVKFYRLINLENDITASPRTADFYFKIG